MRFPRSSFCTVSLWWLTSCPFLTSSSLQQRPFAISTDATAFVARHRPLSSSSWTYFAPQFCRSFGFASTLPATMPRGIKKENLPTKTCVTCGRPFTWRKKWERCWDEVTTCSKSCNNKRRLASKNNADADREREMPSLLDREVEGENVKTQYQTVRAAFSEQTTSNPGPKHAEVVNKLSFDVIGDDVPTSVTEDDMDDLYEKALLDALSFHNTLAEHFKTPDTHEKDISDQDIVRRQKLERKAAKKAKKAERRAQRQGRGDPEVGKKPCDRCGTSVNLLIRCMYEEGQADWKMVCGKCWHAASGGVVDGDSLHPHYRYGGLWKNRRRQG